MRWMQPILTGLLTITLAAGTLNAQSIRDLASDTWVATDAPGRPLPGREDCGPLKPNRTVGIFYFLTATENQADAKGPFDVTRIKAANPEHPQWGSGAHFWGEPEDGYYLSADPWIIRKHARLLADAGVDTLIFDTTNDRTMPDVYMVILETFRQMRAEGEATPQVCFLASRRSIELVWDELYSKGLYEELWFHWDGKPLLLHGQHIGMLNLAELPAQIREFFTLRESWAWRSLPWYDGGRDDWPWVAHYPQPVGWHESPDQIEQVPVAVAQHPLSNIGRSFHNFHQPAIDRYDVTPWTGDGLHFQEQWNRALEVDPPFVFITGWNEWRAGAKIMENDISRELSHWCFYPGAHMGMAGREIHTGDAYFIDQYNQEFSRDIEPMKGGHTDNYYYQMVANIRRYKGVREPEAASAALTIGLDGGFAQWDAVAPEYRDHSGDTTERNHEGWGTAGPYINKTGRNDLVTMKVARDAEHVYFYAATREPLTPSTDPFWMTLFIDADQQNLSGWEGYDYRIGGAGVDARTMPLLRCADGVRWEEIGRVPYHAEGRQVMLAVPRRLLAKAPGPLGLDFHWSDNLAKLNDLEAFFTTGDSAPERRFNYRYQTAD